jgi:hypothetical protein
MGYACHLNEFEHAWSGRDGGCIGEELVRARNRGAIASVASSGYEWLHTNPDAQIYTTRPLFWDLARDPETGRPRRLLGEAMNRGLIAMAAERGGFSSRDYNEMLRTYLTLGDPALRIDVRVPAFQVRVNDEIVENGTQLVGEDLGDSLSVAAVISDDVDVATLRVFEDGTEIPAENLRIIEPETVEHGSLYRLEFTRALRFGNYEIRIEARDWTGREAAFVIPIQIFTVEFAAGGLKLWPDETRLTDATTPISIRLESGEALTQDAFTITVDGEVRPERMEPEDEANTIWGVELEPQDAEGWSPGSHSVTLTATVEGSVGSSSASFEVSQDPLALREVYFYPNPLEAPPGDFVYTLNRSAMSGDLAIYTVRGRQVLRREIPAVVGRNSFSWNLQDEAGDQVANGVYLFVLQLNGADGESVRHMERVAVTR